MKKIVAFGLALMCAVGAREPQVAEDIKNAWRFADQLSDYYAELRRVMYQEVRDLDRMPAPPDFGGNLGPGPRGYVDKAFRGQSLQQRQIMMKSWLAEAGQRVKKLGELKRLLAAEQQKLAGKQPDEATYKDGITVWGYSDPKLKLALSNCYKLLELEKRETAALANLLSRISYAGQVLQPSDSVFVGDWQGSGGATGVTVEIHSDGTATWVDNRPGQPAQIDPSRGKGMWVASGQAELTLNFADQTLSYPTVTFRLQDGRIYDNWGNAYTKQK